MRIFVRIARMMAVLALFVLSGFVQSANAESGKLKIAVLKVGTVNWELDTIKHYGLDKKHGFELDIMEVAGNPATLVAFQGGEADTIVSDWIWVARQRADGKQYSIIPYSKAVGALMVKEDGGINKLADLKGKKIGIAGGPVDKGWLLMRAYAQQKEQMDIAGETEQVFGAPPLIFKAALSGEVQGAINFWHFAAKMSTRGMKPLVTVAEAAEGLGLPTDLPLLGYVFKDEFIKSHGDLVKGFAAASSEAKELLAKDDAAWERLRPIMNVETDADFNALKEGFRQGIPPNKPIDEGAVEKVLELMAKLGGEKLVGKATTLPEGVFVQQ